MTNVTVEYYASLRDAAGRDQETLSTTGTSARDVFQELAARYRFSVGEADLKVAVNDRFADWDAALTDGDKLVFIPPVSGG